jgi:hypothetical protein
MTTHTTHDPFNAIREAGTNGANYVLDTPDIIDRLIQWQSLCSFEVKEAGGDTVDIEFKTLPRDMDAFVRDLYDFCVHEMVDAMEEMGEEISPEMQKIIEGVDFSDENYGLEILKRELEAKKSVQLWWD